MSAVLAAGGDLRAPETAQQLDWADHPAYHRVCRALGSAEPLVGYSGVRSLRRAMAVVAAGDALMIQAGDCAESLHECTRAHTFGKLAVLDRLGDRLGELTGDTVLRVGRIGGQFAKPRSSQVEQHAGRTIPAFRGHLVNSEVPTAAARKPDPRRMLWAYEASMKVLSWTAEYRAQGPRGPWASHEALILDYESRFVRIDPGTGDRYLATTHLPWIGARTNDPDAAHVRLLACVANPVGCKVGPGTEPARLLRLCAALDPHREPGRLVLITRLGRALVDEGLHPLVNAVRKAGHPVVWLSDPMHGNTVRSASGLKTRHLDDMIYEAVAFRRGLRELGVHPGGLHLEVASEPVTECVDGSAVGPDDVPRNYTSLCDPRLNPEQARRLIDSWELAVRTNGIEGKVALVTGAAGGIGGSVARALGDEGAVVAAADIRGELAGSLADDLRADGHKAAGYEVDVSDGGSVAALVDLVGNDLGPIEILVSVAGVLRPRTIADTTEDDWAATFAINANGVFNLCRAVMSGMVARRSGSIVTVASNAAGVPRMHMAAYSASKAASAMFTKCLGLELARHGIRCNVVCPGSTETPMLHSLWRDGTGRESTLLGSLDSYRVGIPLGRIGLPQDVADAVVFLASDRARHITMHDLYVDGGASLH